MLCFLAGVLTTAGIASSTTISTTRMRSLEKCLWYFLLIACCTLLMIPILSFVDHSACAVSTFVCWIILFTGVVLYGLLLCQRSNTGGNNSQAIEMEELD
ncbi:hypothetical protein [Candidatus Similichlamydia laticola]|nr:hypothetical protein [Candidatus Similichlamydia laticola]